MEYHPDRWILLRFSKNQEVFYKVFATWAGGYLGADSWQLNSGVTQLEETETHYLFGGTSGSIYHCRKNSYGSTMYGFGVLGDLMTKALDQGTVIDALPDDTDFTSISYE
jgi:hypothetical protein